MAPDRFFCPACKAALTASPRQLTCPSCGKHFPIVGGIADFFAVAGAAEAIDAPNATWLDPQIVEARDTVYRFCARELRGMAFCVAEIGRRSGPGCRVLEVGMGTGHFTGWLAEATKPGTEVYAFDCSWPIIERAKVNVDGLSAVTLFRANSRGPLPFRDGEFDVLLVRLAPLGPHGVPNVKAAHSLLRPGGWYFEAGWAPARYETPATEWAMRHGYDHAEIHEWRYWREQTAEEVAASQLETQVVADRGGRVAADHGAQARQAGDASLRDGLVRTLTQEYVLIAHKPG